MENFTIPVFGSQSSISLWHGDALNCYQNWPTPTAIIVDGPYGVGGFSGDPKNVDPLPQWYAPHVAAWSSAAKPETTLWFWGTELGWATVHPLLSLYGWDYQESHIWDKGVSHIAGNVNSKTIRSTPVVTEICVRYTRKVLLPLCDGSLVPIKEWLRAEWHRSGLPLSKANEACGVKNAATRKYFTKDDLWYFPPSDAMQNLADFANQFGAKTSVPYFSLDGRHSLTAEAWSHMRAKWNHIHGITNVWHVPALHGTERLKMPSGKAVHYNQKPLEIIDYLLKVSTDEGDVIWDPFAGLATTAVCCMQTGRKCFCAEIASEVYQNSVERVMNEFEKYHLKKGVAG